MEEIENPLIRSGSRTASVGLWRAFQGECGLHGRLGKRTFSEDR